jgi:hypothetical protein
VQELKHVSEQRVRHRPQREQGRADRLTNVCLIFWLVQ